MRLASMIACLREQSSADCARAGRGGTIAPWRLAMRNLTIRIPYLALALLTLGALPVTASAQPLITIDREDYASAPGARGAAAADFDNDGWADIAQSNTGSNAVTVLLNRRGNRDGFVRQADIPVGIGPFDMVTADFNLDKNADLAVANADGDTLSILLGRGNGMFTRTDLAAPGNPRGIATADVNRDGRPDLIYTGFGINRMQVLLGDGAGGFTQGWSMTGVAQRPQGVAPADFNKDGRVDVAVAYASPGGLLAVMYTAGNGAPAAQTIPGEDNLNVVTTGDFNNDGWQDAAAVSTGNSRLAVYLGSAAGLRYAKTYPTGASPRGLIAADVNHDGLLDLVAANKEANTINVFTGRADAPGSFTSMEYAAGRGSRSPVAADFDHDGRLDLATGNQDEAAATVFWNDTSFARAGYVFSEGTLASPDNSSAERIIVTDLNHNAVPDLIAGWSYIVDNATSRTFPASVELGMAVADFNGDGHIDVAGAVRSAAGSYFDKIRILAGDGAGGFSLWRDVQSPSRLGWIGAADMNRDGRPDVVAAGFDPSGPSTVDVMLNRGDGTWAPRVRTVLPQPVRDLALADLNRDGITDVLVIFDPPGQLAVYVGTGGGAFAGPTVHGLGQYAARIATGDLNEDGSVDVVVGVFERMNVFLGSPAGGLTRAADVPVGGNQIALADINMDGHLDIIGGYPSSIVLGNGDGTFQPPDLFVFDFYVAIADLNLDGLPDIVTDQRIVQNRRSETNRPPVFNFPIRDYRLEYRVAVRRGGPGGLPQRGRPRPARRPARMARRERHGDQHPGVPDDQVPPRHP